MSSLFLDEDDLVAALVARTRFSELDVRKAVQRQRPIDYAGLDGVHYPLLCRAVWGDLSGHLPYPLAWEAEDSETRQQEYAWADEQALKHANPHDETARYIPPIRLSQDEIGELKAWLKDQYPDEWDVAEWFIWTQLKRGNLIQPEDGVVPPSD